MQAAVHPSVPPPLTWEVNYVDIDRAEDEWRPIVDAAWQSLQSVSIPSILLHPQNEIREWIARLVPWNIKRIQLAKQPKANRYPSETLATHRATILLYADDSVTFRTEKIADAYALNERFSRYAKPVRMGIFIFGDALGDGDAEQVQQQTVDHHPPPERPGVISKIEQSPEI